MDNDNKTIKGKYYNKNARLKVYLVNDRSIFAEIPVSVKEGSVESLEFCDRKGEELTSLHLTRGVAEVFNVKTLPEDATLNTNYELQIVGGEGDNTFYLNEKDGNKSVVGKTFGAKARLRVSLSNKADVYKEIPLSVDIQKVDRIGFSVDNEPLTVMVLQEGVTTNFDIQYFPDDSTKPDAIIALMPVDEDVSYLNSFQLNTANKTISCNEKCIAKLRATLKNDNSVYCEIPVLAGMSVVKFVDSQGESINSMTL